MWCQSKRATLIEIIGTLQDNLRQLQIVEGNAVRCKRYQLFEGGLIERSKDLFDNKLKNESKYNEIQ